MNSAGGERRQAEGSRARQGVCLPVRAGSARRSVKLAHVPGRATMAWRVLRVQEEYNPAVSAAGRRARYG